MEKSLPARGRLLRGGSRWDRAWALPWSDRLGEATAAFNALLADANALGDTGRPGPRAVCSSRPGERAGDAARGPGVRRGLPRRRRSLPRRATEATVVGERRSLKIAVITGRSAIALLELSRGAYGRVEAELADLERELTAAGVGDPGGMRFVPDYMEALVGLRELDQAKAVIGRYEAHAVRLDRPAARASVLRCRGLIDAARGDHNGALRAFAGALEQHDRLVLPMDRARTLLAQGAL